MLPSLVFDDVGGGTCRIFEAPVATIRVHVAAEVADALRQLQERIDAGFHVAGYFSYELGYALEPRLADLLPPACPTPLLWFAVFAQPPREIAGEALERAWQPRRAYAGPLAWEWDEAGYAAKFAQVAEHIRAGDLYQANLSMRGRFAVMGDPRGLYLALRQAGGGAYSAYVDDGTRQILSFSPELFFDLRADGTLTCRPMKGTAPRQSSDPAGSPQATQKSPFGTGEDSPLRMGENAAGALVRAALQSSAKNRAENLMIVDLVRNDLGRVASTGSVEATRLFEIESYPTVHQMVSTVTAQLRSSTSVQQLLAALFPCGSVTGAPKIRAMQVIRELETSPRGIYCGAIGWFAPDRSARFNVAIRTLTIAGGRGELGAGGGLVADSCAADEYAECRLKARYFEAARRPLKLIETLRLEADGYCRLELHLQRLEASAAAFCFPFDCDRVLVALAAAVAAPTASDAPDTPGVLATPVTPPVLATPITLVTPSAPVAASSLQSDVLPLRVRLTLDEQGQIEVTTAVLEPGPAIWRYVIAGQALDSRDPLLRHKTDWRESHDAQRQLAARDQGCDEVLLCNERGELCEGSRSNLFLAHGDKLLTPAISSGLLPGCLRQELLVSGRCREAVLTPADLDAADQVYFGNSLHGLVPAVFMSQDKIG